MSYLFQRLNVSDFREAFRQCGRADQFSYNALGALFDYLSNVADDTGGPIELDPVALCVEWSEYDSAREAARQYNRSNGFDNDAEALEYLNYQTTVIPVGNEGGILITDF